MTDQPTKEHRLDPEDFPFTIETLRSDTEEFVWGVTVLLPPDGTLAPVYIPPCAEWVGVPVFVRTLNAQGVTTITGPYEKDD